MKFKICDIVIIKKLKLEGMIVSIGLDLETNQEKYQIHIQNQDYTYFCKEEDLEYKTNLDAIVEECLEDNQTKGQA